MANRNSAGFGLIPTRVLGQGPATAGFGQYWIDAADGTTIYNGEAVYSAVGSILGAQGSANKKADVSTYAIAAMVWLRRHGPTGHKSWGRRQKNDPGAWTN